MHVLVLGAYGLIGLEAARGLIRAGHQVTGLARSSAKGKAVLPDVRWIEADLEELSRAEDWRPHLNGIDAVVNAAGALQSGLRDNVKRIQQDAMCALFEACAEAGANRFVQISAVGVAAEADTECMRTKAVAHDALRASGLNWVILKPGLVIAIEPMFNLGVKETKTLDDGWTVVTADGRVSAHWEDTVAVTKDGPVVLTRPVEEAA